MRRLFKKHQPQSEGAPAGDQRMITDAKVLPTTLRLASIPTDLPNYSGVLSGADKRFSIRLDADKLKMIAVIRLDSKNAMMVVNSTIYGSQFSRELIQEVRGKLHSDKMESETMWATPELIEQLATLRPEEKAIGKLHDNTPTETGTESWNRFLEWIRHALKVGSSDIHVEIRKDHAQVRFRVLGELEEMIGDPNGGRYLPQLALNSVSYVYNKKADAGSTSSTLWSATKSMYHTLFVEVDNVTHKIRAQQIPGVNDSLDLVMRIVPAKKKYTYSQLGLLPSQIAEIERATTRKKGLIIATGETNSGKSTLLRTITDHLPNRAKRKLAEIGDPIEIEDPTVSQRTIQRDITNPRESEQKIAEAIGDWLRGDPDVLTLSEIRDHATGIGALAFTQSGHLSLGTSHVGSVFGIPERLCSPLIGLDLHSLTAPGTLTCMIGLQLVPVLCGNCKIPLADMDEAVRERMAFVGRKFGVDVSQMAFRNECGCDKCNGRGATELTAIAEVVRPDDIMLKHFRNRDDFAAIEHWRSKSDRKFDTPNMMGKTIFEHALYLALLGKIDPSCAEGHALFEDYTTGFPVEIENTRAA